MGCFTPDLVMPYSNIKVSWICEKGHKYEATIGNRTVNDHGCPFCSGSKLLIGYNDFETWCKNNGREDLLKEWNYEKNEILPTEVTFGSGKYVWWKCNKNHEWRTQVIIGLKVQKQIALSVLELRLHFQNRLLRSI
mgnify:CR=1 FL=1